MLQGDLGPLKVFVCTRLLHEGDDQSDGGLMPVETRFAGKIRRTDGQPVFLSFDDWVSASTFIAHFNS